ncbi:response regulator [Pedobacter sp. SL55]|uniref:response regulator n=1 Tax=Pedobacter sp. SL55 TaxID=2995161 RepID=UPI002271E5D4|nr:response regulator transcription factor [Pedobacter sp. SL55]WAC42380.1 response regulator transcription factor [Pedobacter sp. SL55]
MDNQIKKRVVIFDDDQTRRDSLTMLLNMCNDMECVGAFVSAANAVANVQATQPDMVLMDIDMPLGDGITGTKKIKQNFPDLIVIMQTVFDDSQHIFEAIKAGANGYLLKKTSPDKLLEQIREAFQGGAPMTGAVAIKVLDFLGKNQFLLLTI